MAEVTVRRTELPTPTIDDPERKVIQVEYRLGELPPRFIIIPKAEYTKEKEAELIKADIEARKKVTEERLEI